MHIRSSLEMLLEMTILEKVVLVEMNVLDLVYSIIVLTTPVYDYGEHHYCLVSWYSTITESSMQSPGCYYRLLPSSSSVRA